MSGFVARVRPDYGWQDKIVKLSPEAFEQWKAQAHSITQMDSCTTPEDVKKLSVYADLIMDAEEMAAWTVLGIELRLSRVRGLASNVRSYGGRGTEDFAQTVYQIHVANVGLMQILQVEVLENECTHELQDWLNRGWRILAVCPPNDTRRPSYIIGHTEKGAT